MASLEDQLSEIRQLIQKGGDVHEYKLLEKDLEELISLQQTVVKYSIGQLVEVLYQDKWFPSVVLGAAPQSVDVEYLTFHTVDKDIPMQNVRSITLLDKYTLLEKDEIKVDTKCTGKYYVDQKPYDCIVKEITNFGVKVEFTAYGNMEEVPYSYLYRRNVAAKTATKAVKSMMKIPANLKIGPTDSEQEKERKKKRIKAIKSKNRHASIENERNAKQAGWQQFCNKKKRTGIVKNSIFQSPSTVDGKVGVVNSGQPMTCFEDTRKRYKLNSK